MIHLFTYPLFLKYTQHDSLVVELGDQLINMTFYEGGPHVRKRSIDHFKDIAPELNITSIDNRQNADRALNLDLSKNIPNKSFPYFGKADVLTDFGTLEHVVDIDKKTKKNKYVSSLYYALKNAFNFVKTGGVFIHSNPKEGNFPGHAAYHYFVEEFWIEYAKLAGLTVLEIGEHPAENNTTNGWEIFAVLEKDPEAKFPTRKDFDILYKKYITKE